MAHLWHSTIFGLAALLLAYALRRNRASTRFYIWLAASLKFLIPFSLLIDFGRHVDVPRIASATAALPSGLAQFALSSPTLEFHSPAAAPHAIGMPRILMAIWLGGVVFLLLRWAAQWIALRRCAASGRSMAIGTPIPVRSTPHPIEPGVFGIFRPVLLLPEGIVDRLPPEQMAAIVAHELCHVRRRDNLTAAIHTLIQAAFWFHPLVWWIGTRLVDERERACDEEVLRLGNEPAAYAEGILNVCKFCLEAPMPCLAGVTGADLKKRIEAIMTESFSLQLTAARKLLLAAAGFLALAAPVGVGLLHPARSRAQAPAPSIPVAEFEVVSIKPSAPDQQGTTIMDQPGGGLRATNVTPKQLIAIAYDLRDFQISGAPSWLNSEHYDITAKPPAGAAPEGDRPSMTEQQRMESEQLLKARVRALFADRFHLVVRQETKDMPVYALVVAKGGSKLKRSEGDGSGNRGIRIQRGMLSGTQTPVRFLAETLSNVVAKPVVDKTGLTGKYDWKLEWTPDQGQMKPGAPNDKPETTAPDLSGPSIFTAIQEQLGLKLESIKAPAPMLIIERVEKPSAN